jgi:hypothetical protein
LSSSTSGVQTDSAARVHSFARDTKHGPAVLLHPGHVVLHHPTVVITDDAAYSEFENYLSDLTHRLTPVSPPRPSSMACGLNYKALGLVDPARYVNGPIYLK